jgi:hypothetical protein
LALDQPFNIPSLEAEPFDSLFECDDGENVQEYGAMTEQWPSENSFAIHDNSGDCIDGDGANFDLWMQGQRDQYPDPAKPSTGYFPTTLTRYSPGRGPSGLTERKRRLQIVRSWLSDHASWPYPSQAERSELIAATGCTERQLNVCLSNLRSREKHCKSIVTLQLHHFD